MSSFTIEAKDNFNLQDYEFQNLHQIERRINGTSRRLPQHLRCRRALHIDLPTSTYQIQIPLLDQHGIKYIDEGIVNHQRFEQNSNDSSAFSQNENCSVYEREMDTLEDGEESGLWEIGEGEECG